MKNSGINTTTMQYSADDTNSPQTDHCNLIQNEQLSPEHCKEQLLLSPATDNENDSNGAITSPEQEERKDLLSHDNISNSDHCPVVTATGGTAVTTARGKFRWTQLRNTVKVAGAVTSPANNRNCSGGGGGGTMEEPNDNQKTRRRKTDGLVRQDSFLMRFSTRHGGGGTNQDNDEMDEEELERAANTPSDKWPTKVIKKPLVIHPDENFMFYWLGVLTLAILYNLWTCIAREAFPDIQRGYGAVWFLLDGICDVLYLMDIIIQLRTGYLERGLIVYDSRQLAKHYVYNKDFLIDLLSLLPLDFIQFKIGIHPLVRFPRFVKVYRSYRFMFMVETRTVYPNLVRVANLTHVLFLGSHWFAAFYFMISKAEGFKGKSSDGTVFE